MNRTQCQCTRLEYGLLALIALAALLLRMNQLGAWNFGTDEILHIYAAQEILDGRPPELPSGYPYVRALLYTWSVAAIGAVAGLDEASARLPGVFFGLACVLAVFFIVRSWYSTGAALLAAFLVAVMPVEIHYSREVRMYGLFQLLHLATLFLIFRGLEADSKPAANWIRPQRLRDWSQALGVDPLFLLAAFALLLLATSVHKLMVGSLAGVWAYLACVAILGARGESRGGPAQLKYAVLAIAPLAIGLACWLLVPSLVQHFAATIAYAPTWAEANVDSWAYYLRPLRYDYPIITATFAMAALCALLANFRASLFLICCLAVPLWLHSFVFAWKAERYIHHLLPLLWILWSVGLAVAAAALYRSLATALAPVLEIASARRAAGVAALAAVIALIGTAPWFVETVKTYAIPSDSAGPPEDHPRWKTVLARVAEQAQPGDIVITSQPLQTLYYGPRLPIYQLNNNLADMIFSHDMRDSEGNRIEYTAGAPVIMDVETLRIVFERHPSGWYVTESSRFIADRPTPPAIRDFVIANFESLDVPETPEFSVWRWR